MQILYAIIICNYSNLVHLIVDNKSVLFYENFDTQSMVTPVDPIKLKQILEETNFDSQETKFLVEGFTNGFSLQYQGDMAAKLTASNLPLKGIGDETTLWNKVMKEVKLKRFAGPFSKIPFNDHYIQSPIGLVLKDNGKEKRLIFHLSHPKGSSINDGMPDEFCAVKYPEFEKAIRLCIKEGKGCKISTSDIKSAFRNLCIRIQDHWLLVISCRNPIDKKWYHFFDKCLPFGHSISCNLFQRFSNSIAHVI